MHFSLESRQPGPSPWLVVALCTVYLLAGLIGHDPWKSEDAVGLAIAHGFFVGDGWWVPSLAGEAWSEAEPLYHWLAAISAWATQALLPFHDGARLASGIFGGLFLVFMAGAARRLYGSDAAWGAPLLAIGTLGLLVPLHEAQPAAAVLASLGAVYWGAALQNERPLAGALLMGSGLGASFLAGGLGGVLPGLTLLAIPLLQKRWPALLIVLGLGAVIAGAWPLLLSTHHPTFFTAWWTTELTSITPRELPDVDHVKFIGWFAWPVLFIAPWALWRNRRRISDLSLALPLLGAATALIWFLAHEPKVASTLPLLPPLILLAASGTERLRRGAANAWDWFGMVTFTIVTALVWLAASAMFTGWPPKIASNIAKLEPGFVAQFSLPAMLVAVAATIAWIAVLLRLPRSPWRVANRWAAGVTVMWVLVVALLMPWIDYGKTYRPVVASLAKALPADPGCIGRRHLGATQRAALDYFVGIRTRYGLKGCEWLIMQGGRNETAPAGWTRTWEGHRPGDRGEWLRLYRRD